MSSFVKNLMPEFLHGLLVESFIKVMMCLKMDGLRVPEVRLPLLLGIFGSAFCATLNLYYKEVRPMIQGTRRV